MSDLYLIYSNSNSIINHNFVQNAWWKSHGNGYARLKDAGRFTEKEIRDFVMPTSNISDERVLYGSPRFIELVERDPVDETSWYYEQKIDKIKQRYSKIDGLLCGKEGTLSVAPGTIWKCSDVRWIFSSKEDWRVIPMDMDNTQAYNEFVSNSKAAR